MTATLLDGKRLAAEIQAEVAKDAAELQGRTGIQPCLAVVLVGDQPASEVYVKNKRQACQRCGIRDELHRLPSSAGPADILSLIQKLNDDPSVHGILVQLPLPGGVESRHVLDAVSPLKDVDAFHPENVGLLVQGHPRFLPCTPYGVQQLLVRNGIEVAGRHAVVLGRSDIVGKPMANMLLQRGSGADATVTVCHSRTEGLLRMTRSAEILIVAVGRPKFVTADMVQQGAVVIDVGIHRTAEGLVGDVDFAAVAEVAGMITPVPGGVGPLTVTMLLRNTLTAAALQAEG